MSRTARLCVLGSGSGGNCSWLSLPSEASGSGHIELLIDAGLSPRATFERLAARRLPNARPAAIILTHADTDHFRPTWVGAMARRGIRLYARRAHHGALRAMGAHAADVERLEDGDALPGVRVRFETLPHDELGSTAYRIESGGASIGWATDLGRATPPLLRLMRGVDLLAIESNYCPELQHASSRPLFLKRRIMGGKGHLSNQQCLEAIRELDDDGPPQRLVLLHLSRECNRPQRIQSLWKEHAPRHWERVTLTSQDRPTRVLSFGRAGAQLGLFA